MSFYGKSFIYNFINSEMYDIYISDIDTTDINQSMGNASSQIYEQKIFRKPTPYFLGSTPTPRLSFKMSMFTEYELTAQDAELAQKVFFGSKKYLPLQIDQPDMQDVVFYAILNNPQINRIGNLIRGFDCLVDTNSPYAYKMPSTLTKTYTQTIVNDEFVFNNQSDDINNYLYPVLKITLNNINDDIGVQIVEDNNRQMTFTNLSANEILNINCELQTIISSTNLHRLGNSNYKFLRLVPGVNHIILTGNISKFEMTTQFVAKKISG